MTPAWILKKTLLISAFMLVVLGLHWMLSGMFNFAEAFQGAIIIHIFLYFITAFVFIIARKINDQHPDYTTEVMLGANAAKMLLAIAFFITIYLVKTENKVFAYSFLGIYFFYLPFNAWLYLKQFKIEK